MENIEIYDTHVKNTSLNDNRVIESKLQHPNVSRVGWIMTGVITMLFIIYFASYQTSTDNTSASTTVSETPFTYMVHIIIFLIIVYLVYVCINSSKMKEVDTEIKEIIDPIKNLVREKQVFHIPSNTYTYTDAKAVCNAYNSDLASYDEISDAFGKGADWCSYGWSEGQMAFFPTQEEKWNDLQNVDGHEHDCGRPGINGGYIANPNVRFGANCYGQKPDITLEESDAMINQPAYNKTSEEIQFDVKVDYYKNKLKDILVAPFNNSSWSERI
jgi:hypothetical protein